MSHFFPNVTAKTAPAAPMPRYRDPKLGRFAPSRSGKIHGGGTSKQPDPGGLEEWEGVTTFRDSRSPTGWIDLQGHVIANVDTHGVVLLPDKTTGKLSYYDGHETKTGLTFGKAVGFFGGDLFGLALDFSGNEKLNTLRLQAGATAAAGLLGSGAITGKVQAEPTSGAAGGGGTMKFADVFSTENSGGLPDWLKNAAGVVDAGIDAYERVTGGNPPRPAQTPPMTTTTVTAASMGVPPLILLGSIVLAYFLLVKEK